MRYAGLILLCLASSVVATGTAAAQTWPPRSPSIGDPLAAELRYRVETQRLQSEQQAAFARQTATAARLRALEIEAARQPEPYIRRETPLRSHEQERLAREEATARREAVARGVTQIDDWLARTPR